MFLSGLCLMRIMSMYFNYVMDIFETWIVKGVDFIFKAFKILDIYILLDCILLGNVSTKYVQKLFHIWGLVHYI